MTLDKFNRPLHHHKLVISHSLHYETLFYVVGIYTKDGKYRLRNSSSEDTYLFPLLIATIKEAVYTPASARIFINETEYPPSALRGLTLKQNDQIKVAAKRAASTVYDPEAVFVLQLLLTVPIQHDIG